MTSWDVETDLVIVGYGGAGASAAIEARAAGLRVLILERYEGGGATALSGGQVYIGGGTRYQKEAGFDDTPQQMYDYLKLEVGDAVSDATLRRFCDESGEMLAWLEAQGVPFEGSYCPFKTSIPPDQYYLNYTGNEIASPYADITPPMPRGHRVRSPGTSGHAFFEILSASAERNGAEVKRHARVTRLIEERGRVVGVEFESLPPERAKLKAVYRFLLQSNGKLSLYAPWAAQPINKAIAAIERSGSKVTTVRAIAGVVLSAGGFVFNKKMVKQNAPLYADGRPLGTIADDGSGIRLGEQVGGAVDRLDSVSGWRFIYPPMSMVKGVMVGPSGRRVCNEMLYGATVTKYLVEHHGGRGWLILDQKLWDEVQAEIPEQTSPLQRIQIGYLFSPRGHKKAADIASLARAIDIEVGALEQTMAVYNRDAADGTPDGMRKSPHYVQPLDTGPYYAINCSVKNSQFYPCPMITLGGLVVDENTGHVKRANGSIIEGLFAAGRNAVGICSNAYISGLSLADCVFSGRRAAKSAAAESLIAS